MGLIGMILSAVGDFLALGFAPQSIVAPLGSVTLVANVFFAPCLLKEKIGARDIISTIIIAAGCTLAVAFASHSEADLSNKELYALFRTKSFIFYAICTLGLGLSMFFTMKSLDRLRDTAYSQNYRKYTKLHRFIVPALSGLTGAQNVLFAKCTSQLVINLMNGSLQVLTHWETYVIIFALVTTITLQVKWLNDALMRFDSSYVVPVFQTFWIGGSVISGLIVYQEYKQMDLLHAGMFGLGCLLTIGGVVILSQRSVVLEGVTTKRFSYTYGTIQAGGVEKRPLLG